MKKLELNNQWPIARDREAWESSFGKPRPTLDQRDTDNDDNGTDDDDDKDDDNDN